jgi:hypothetical protein
MIVARRNGIEMNIAEIIKFIFIYLLDGLLKSVEKSRVCKRNC